MNPHFFKTPADFRAWLEKHHATETELWVGYYKLATKKPSITYKEGVDAALCYGWIDGVRHAIDDESYKQRYTPRTKNSIWSNVNVKRVGELTKEGLMHPAGLAAFNLRDEKRIGIYSAENADKAVLPPALEKEFKKNKTAWKNFSAMAPSYRRAAIWLIVSAKKEETRAKRFAELVACSAKGTTIPTLTRKAKKT